MEQYFSIGFFIGPHGLNGELILKHDLGKKTAFKGVRCFFLEEPGNKWLPYFLTEAKGKSADESYIQLEGIENREAAKKLSGKKVWLKEEDFQHQKAKAAPISLIGYHIKEADQELGIILEVIEQPFQILCRLEIQEKDVFIPLNESTLQRIDHKKKLVLVELPDGLLDVYLKSNP
jgi:16S rRNA processing protein RimM